MPTTSEFFKRNQIRAASERLSQIEALSPEQQASELAKPGIVFGLAEKGQAAKVIALIEKLSPEQQDSVWAAPGAKEGLTDNGQGEAVEKIQRSAESFQRRAAEVIARIKKLSPEQQAAVLSEPSAVTRLAHERDAKKSSTPER